MPSRDILLRLGGVAGAPGGVHTGPDTNSIADIVGTVGKGRGTGGDNLHEGVEVFGLVGILLGVGVYALHAATFGSAEHTDLSGCMLEMLRRAGGI